MCSTQPIFYILVIFLIYVSGSLLVVTSLVCSKLIVVFECSVTICRCPVVSKWPHTFSNLIYSVVKWQQLHSCNDNELHFGLVCRLSRTNRKDLGEF